MREGIQSDDEYDTFYYASSFYQNYFADRYVREEEFGKEFHALTLNRDGRCLVDDVELYYHGEGHDRDKGYFSTEPALDDYSGISSCYDRVGFVGCLSEGG